MNYSERRTSTLTLIAIASVGFSLFPCAAKATEEPRMPSPQDRSAEYLLGPQDQLAIRISEFEEAPIAPMRIDPAGNIDLPLIGPVHAAGLTVPELRTQLTSKFSKYIRGPVVSVSVVDFHSQPVTVIGEVKQPGVHQVEGPKRLLEIISMAGGLTETAGSKVTITRETASGPIPLPETRTDLSGRYTVAEIDLGVLIASGAPSKNIIIRPNDVIAVSTADLVYVLGEVKKPGGYTLHSHTSVSVLEALGMAEGLEKTASPKKAWILRVVGDGKDRAEIPTDVAKIMEGKSPDVPLRSKDILVIPNNLPRAAAVKGLDAAIQLGTGVLIYHGLR